MSVLQETFPDELVPGADLIGDSEHPLGKVLDELLGETGKLPLLTAHEEKVLGYRIQNGDIDAKEQMILHNLRLVASFISRYKGYAISPEDLFMEGYLGLNEAVEKFDPDRGYRFSTPAGWWIRQAMQKAIQKQAKTVREPESVNEDLRYIERLEQDYYKKTGGKISFDQLIKESGLSAERINYILAGPSSVSMNTIVTDDGSTEFGDLFEDTSLVEVPEQVLLEERKNALYAALGRLSQRERDIIELRYGLNGPEMEAEEIGDKLGLSRPHVMYLQKEILERLSGFGELAEVVIDDDFEALSDEEIEDRIHVIELKDKKSRPRKLELKNEEIDIIKGLAEDKSYPELSLKLGIPQTTLKYRIFKLYRGRLGSLGHGSKEAIKKLKADGYLDSLFEDPVVEAS